MMGFGADLKRFCEATKARTSEVVRGTALQAQASMVEMAPVDTGRLKSNFQVGFDQINKDTSSAAGADAIARAAITLKSWRPGETIFLTNSLPYAVVIEYGLYGKPPGSANGPKTRMGYSSQAVGGFARLTAQAFEQQFAKAVKGLR